jgi:hypothetical protein
MMVQPAEFQTAVQKSDTETRCDLANYLAILGELFGNFQDVPRSRLLRAISTTSGVIIGKQFSFCSRSISAKIRMRILKLPEAIKPHGRPQTVQRHAEKARKLFKQGLSKSEIARRLSIGRTSVIRLLAD